MLDHMTKLDRFDGHAYKMLPLYGQSSVVGPRFRPNRRNSRDLYPIDDIDVVHRLPPIGPAGSRRTSRDSRDEGQYVDGQRRPSRPQITAGVPPTNSGQARVTEYYTGNLGSTGSTSSTNDDVFKPLENGTKYTGRNQMVREKTFAGAPVVVRPATRRSRLTSGSYRQLYAAQRISQSRAGGKRPLMTGRQLTSNAQLPPKNNLSRSFNSLVSMNKNAIGTTPRRYRSDWHLESPPTSGTTGSGSESSTRSKDGATHSQSNDVLRIPLNEANLDKFVKDGGDDTVHSTDAGLRDMVDRWLVDVSRLGERPPSPADIDDEPTQTDNALHIVSDRD